MRTLCVRRRQRKQLQVRLAHGKEVYSLDDVILDHEVAIKGRESTVTLGAASKWSGCLRKDALRGPGEENTSSIAYK